MKEGMQGWQRSEKANSATHAPKPVLDSREQQSRFFFDAISTGGQYSPGRPDAAVGDELSPYNKARFFLQRFLFVE